MATNISKDHWIHITDEALDQLIRALEDLERGQCTKDGGTLILLLARPALEELRDHRRRAAEGLELDPGAVVVPLRPLT